MPLRLRSSVQPDFICDTAIFVSQHNKIASFDQGLWNCGLEAFRGHQKKDSPLNVNKMKEHCHFPLVFIYMYLRMGDIFFSKPSHSSSRYFCKNKPIVLEYKEHACRSTCIMLMQISEINRMPEIQRHLKYRLGRASCSYEDRNTKNNILMGQCQQEIAAVHYFIVKRKKIEIWNLYGNHIPLVGT